MSKRFRNRLGTGNPEIVDVIGTGSAGKIGIDHEAGEIRAIAGDAVVVVDVRHRVEFCDKGFVLLDAGGDLEHVDIAYEICFQGLGPVRLALSARPGETNPLQPSLPVALL